MRLRNSLKAGAVLVLCSCLAALFSAAAPPARAENPQETAVPPEIGTVLARMGKSLQATDLSFESDTLRAYAGPNGELLHVAHKSKIVVQRPDRLLVDATGDDGATKMVYDGKNFIIYAVDDKQYASVAAPAKLDETLDFIETRLGVDMPLADFLSDDPDKSLLNGITSGGEVGTAEIDGTKCLHFYFIQAPDLELELWVEDNERALPRRLVVTYDSLPGRPRFIALLSHWDLTTKHADSEFAFQPPAGVKEVQIAQRSGVSPPEPKK